MIPIKLEFEAFGPFLKKQTINFGEFESEKIFLISGQTGSGKTTIFDAITFSLFGETSGSVRQTDCLKSQFADEKDLCYVEFEFCVHNKNYKVYREPIQLKLKRGGNLVRTPSAVATLTLEDGQIITGRDVDKYIEQLLGINSDQFKKIVMLPQGEFKKFLLDDSAEKQKILRTIFNTKILNDFTEKLRDNMNSYKQKHDIISTQQNAYLSSIKCEKDEELYGEINLVQKDISHIKKLLKENIKNAQEKIEQQTQNLNVLSSEIKEINLPFYKEINQKFLQLSNITAEILELKNQKPQFDINKNQLVLLKKVKEILPIYNLKTSVLTQLDEQKGSLSNYKKSLNDAKINLDNEKKINQECENQTKNEPEIILKIENISEQYKILDEIETNKSFLITAQSEIKKTIINKNSLDVYVDYLEICEKIQMIEDKVTLAKDTLNKIDLYDDLVVEFKEKSKKYETVFHAYLNCQSAILAQKLEENSPCPVCGSTKHPDPAIFYEEKITENQLEKEKTSYEIITKELQRSKTICHQNINAFFGEEIEKKIFESKILINEKVIELSKQLALQKNKRDEIVLVNELKKLSPLRKIETVQKRINELSQEIAILNEKKENISNEIFKLQSKLPIEVIDKNSLDITKKQLTSQLTKIRTDFNISKEKLEKFQSDFVRLSEGYSLTLDIVEKLKIQFLQHSENFNLQLLLNEISQEIFLENINQTNCIENLSDRIDEFENSYKVKTAFYNTLNEQLQGKKNVDILELEKKLIIKQTKYDEINALILQNSAKTINNKNLYEQIKTAVAQQKKIDEKYSNYTHLFDVSNGKFSDKTNFERYVLASYFDDVIECANVKLEQMTASRYTLSRRKEKEKNGKSSGLSLNIFDSYNGGTRHVNSLSGGETFKVALCLALGLSNVISQNSGGIELNTMFIDEGFGSLDPDSIDSAIECLNELILDGRYIGIISHVNELKEKIPAKIIVTQTTSGSYINLS